MALGVILRITPLKMHNISISRFVSYILLAIVFIYLVYERVAVQQSTIDANHSEHNGSPHVSSGNRTESIVLSTPTNTTSIHQSHIEPNTEGSLQDITNATLGFERLFAISLKDRMDKHDSLTVAASVSGIKLGWVDGVKLEDIPEKAYPVSWERNREKPLELGAWRAHMNAMQMIVANGINSALIMEDDADWDVTLKAQLQEFARGTRALQGNSSNDSHSPYGDNWELLWLGHCGVDPGNVDTSYVIPNDPTLSPPDRLYELRAPPVPMQNSRYVFEGIKNGLCTIAYAVTYEGARRLLARLSMYPNNDPFDWGITAACEDTREGFPFRCFAPYPHLIGSWRRAGPSSGDSDIIDMGNEWHDASTAGVTYSTMFNAHDLAHGAKFAKASWPEVEQQSIDPVRLEIPRGRLINFNEPEETQKLEEIEDSDDDKLEE